MIDGLNLDLFYNVTAQVLIHFWWQGLVVALLTIFLLKVGNFRSPFVRYYITLGGFVLMLACPIITGVIAFENYEAVVKKQPIPIGTRFNAEIPVDSQLITNATISNQNALDNGLLARINAVIERFQFPILICWLCGIVLMMMRMSVSWYGCKRLQWSSSSLSKSLARRFDLLKSRMKAPSAVAIRSAKNLNQAVAVGLIKPMVLIPASWLSEIPLKSLEAIVAHELAHIRRFDLWVNMLQRIVESLFFYHPAVWWISRRIRVEREMCCDKIASEAINDPVTYAKTLSQIATIQFDASTNLSFGVNFLGGPKMLLLARIKNVLTPDTQPKFGAGVAALSMALLLALPVFGWAAIHATVQQEDEKSINEERKRAEEAERAAREKAIAWLRAQADELAEESKQEQRRNDERMHELALKMQEMQQRKEIEQKAKAEHARALEQARKLHMAHLQRLEQQEAIGNDAKQKLHQMQLEIEKLQSEGKSKAAKQKLQQLDLAREKMEIEKLRAMQQEAQSSGQAKELVERSLALSKKLKAQHSKAAQEDLKAALAEMKSRMAEQEAQIASLKAALAHAHAQGALKNSQGEAIKKLLESQARQSDQKLQLMHEKALRETMQEKLKQELMKEKSDSDAAEAQRRALEAELRAMKQRMEDSKSKSDKAKREAEEIKKALGRKERPGQPSYLERAAAADLQRATISEQLAELKMALVEVQQNKSDRHPESKAIIDRIRMLEQVMQKLKVEQKKKGGEKSKQDKAPSESPSDFQYKESDFTEKHRIQNPHHVDLTLSRGIRAHVDLASAQNCANCHQPMASSFRVIDSNLCPTIQSMKAQAEQEKRQAISDKNAKRHIDQLNEQIRVLREEIRRLKEDRSNSNIREDQDLMLQKRIDLKIDPNVELKKSGNDILSNEEILLDLKIVPSKDKSDKIKQRPKGNNIKHSAEAQVDFPIDSGVKIKPDTDDEVEVIENVLIDFDTKVEKKKKRTPQNDKTKPKSADKNTV